MVYNPNSNPWTFPVNPNYPWLPKAAVISSITRGSPTVVTTQSAHGYSDGQQVRIFFPNFYGTYLFGMPEIDGAQGFITVLSSTSFSLPIDSSAYTPFTTVSGQSAQVLPIGEVAQTFDSVFTQTNPASRSNAGPLFQPPYPEWVGPI